MKSVSKFLTGFAAGIAVGLTLTLMYHAGQDLVAYQKGYVEGRSVALATTVVLGPEDHTCSVEIPLSTVPDLIRMGFMDWYVRCIEESEQ